MESFAFCQNLEAGKAIFKLLKKISTNNYKLFAYYFL